MARGLNKIQIIGNLGSDPDIKFTPGGSPFTNFSVAVNRGRKGSDGQWGTETDWFRVVCWSKLAETADQYLKKGARVYVEGRLQLRKYTGNDGVERTAVEIVATDLLMLSARESEPVAVRQPFPTDDEDDFDDLPF